jgi:hypothetical protein
LVSLRRDHENLCKQCKKIRDKEYHENNKDRCKEKAKEYREKNAEKIKEKKQLTFVCECGCSLTIEAKYRHIKTKKHLNLMEAKNAQQDTVEINHLK